MKVCYVISEVKVLGYIWMPEVIAATTYGISDRDIESIRSSSPDYKIHRDAVQRWLRKRAGDFSQIIDFSVTIGDGEFDSDWEQEDSETTFSGCTCQD